MSSTRRFRLSPLLQDLVASPQRAVTIFLVLSGVLLRVWQYLANSSLWIDEAALARNIIERAPNALLSSLDYAQVAPIGFLFIEKGITSFVGTSEYALRAFPLVCGLGALFLYWAVAQRVLSGWAVTFAVGLFSLGIPFIYFSSQVKQYSSDVAAALLLLLLALDLRRHGATRRRAIWFGLASVMIAGFSQTSLFVMLGIAFALLILTLIDRDRGAARLLSMVGPMWLLSAAAVGILSVWSVSRIDREYFRWFWGDGFMPLPPQSVSDMGWLPKKLMWVFGAFAPGLGHTNGGLNYRWSPVFAAMMAYGYWALWRKQRDAALFLLLPVLVAVALSAASLYPFTARLLAFLIPFLLLATAAGTSHFLTNLPARFQFLTPVAWAVLGGAPIYAIATALPPSWVQHIRPVMEYVSQRRETDDKIYVYYGAALAFHYYAPRVGIPADTAVVGRCSFAAPREYLREIDRFRGERRVWIVMTHEHRNGELELILGYLDQIGRRLDTVAILASNGRPIEHAYGYLYDLHDRVRLASVSAQTYALPAELKPLTESGQRWGCYGITGGEPLR